ncbi:MAG: signal recognition particle protein, partial [Myxococcales bacterium]|nr:signal recognition particle protein [Myxococcales bacterium]
TGKLANKLLKEGKKPMLVAADIYRPAAVEQLKVLGTQLGVPVFHQPGVTPPDMCHAAIEAAQVQKRDVVLFDTAGRLAIDEQMMAELEAIQARCKPENVLLVADAMIGQDAVRTAAEFDRRLDLSGFILTKLDGDARGGAALSIKEVTGKPIKFLGMGESLDRLEEFRPEGLASRILGFGDIVGLMKDFEQVVDDKTAEEDAAKLLSGKFTFGDFVNQIRMIKRMGPLKDLLEKFPLFGDLGDNLNIDDRELLKIEAIHDSMTPFERKRADLIGESRAARIARGCGQPEERIKEILSRYLMMRDLMGQIGQAPGLLGMLPGIKNLNALRQLKGLGGGGGGIPDLLGNSDALQQQMQRSMFQQQMQQQAQAMGLPKGYTPAMAPAQRAKAVHAGLIGNGGGDELSTDSKESQALRDKRKKERQAKKKARKSRR